LVVIVVQIPAAAALGALYYYVLAHQADFDVCWCKGSVAEVIFKPWLKDIEARGGSVLGSNRVTDVIYDEERNRISGIVAGKANQEVGTFSSWSK
jgi:uncharacterized protein with NAD-binding domain and iron-sulfur cluster